MGQLETKVAEFQAIYAEIGDGNGYNIMASKTLTGTAAERMAQLQARSEEIAFLRAMQPVVNDSQTREYANVQNRADVGSLFDSVVNHRQPTGAMAELQRELHLESNQIPTTMLMVRNAVTPAPTVVDVNQSQIVPYVFNRSVAEFLSIPSPIVPEGEQVFPVLTSDPAPGTPAENAMQSETTGAFSADKLSPARIQASFFYSREDANAFASMGEALRAALSEAMMVKLDSEILQGTKGLLTGTVLANHNVNSITTYDNYVSNLGYGRVDGRFAGDLGDLRVVMGSPSFAHAGTAYRTNGEISAIDRLNAITSGVRVSAHVPPVASNRQNALVRLGTAMDYVAPVWAGTTLIADEVTQAKAGQIVVTAVLLHQVQLLRADGFYKQGTQHA